ncbi:GalNAc(5)-diNAcBac-PP-undecaprenol beta-1,3-glucosyltransferase [Methylophilaceae bacterium]|nr:GalNAc(5)-diNAcBac-PP-undecaprenol beta-1,3-glucosyltransferase [Methylophilaceae bacterium]
MSKDLFLGVAEAKPKITIGIPVYNGEKYIREAIDSVLAQSFTDFELIISDNASTDSTERICRECQLQDKRIKYFRQITNIGIVENFEFVLNQSSSEFFMFLACDDYLESENYLSLMVQKIEDGNDFCFANVKHRVEQADGYHITSNMMDDFIGCKSAFELCKQTVKICSYQLYGLYKSDILKGNFHHLNECKHFKLFAEGLFVHVMMANFSAGFVNNVNLIYRRHGNNESSIQNQKDLIYYFYKFTKKLVNFYWHYVNFSWTQKLVLLMKILTIHGSYFLKLIAQYLIRRS